MIPASLALAGTTWHPMRLNLLNERSSLRDGWRSLFFLLAGMACFVLVGVIGRTLPPVLKAYAPSAVLIALLGLVLTYTAVRMEGVSLKSVGLRLDVRFLKQFGLGLLGGALLVGVSASLVCGWAGVTLVPVETPVSPIQIKLIATILGGAFFEELLFRGYAFQRAMRGMGRWPAIAAFSLLFGLAHLPSYLEVETPMLIAAMAGLLLDCVIQSLILLRTGSLALPIGLHFAWNLLQPMLGFGVSGASASSGWFRPDLGSQPGWLTGGEYGLEASVYALVVQIVLLAWLLWTAQRLPNSATEHPVLS